jgi:hypothetical protein
MSFFSSFGTNAYYIQSDDKKKSQTKEGFDVSFAKTLDYDKPYIIFTCNITAKSPNNVASVFGVNNRDLVESTIINNSFLLTGESININSIDYYKIRFAIPIINGVKYDTPYLYVIDKDAYAIDSIDAANPSASNVNFYYISNSAVKDKIASVGVLSMLVIDQDIRNIVGNLAFPVYKGDFGNAEDRERQHKTEVGAVSSVLVL